MAARISDKDASHAPVETRRRFAATDIEGGAMIKPWEAFREPSYY